MTDVTYYFDFLSPYSFFSWKWFYRNYRDHLCKLGDFCLKPVMLANVIHAWNSHGPAEIAPKREFLMRNCLRYCLKNNIEFNPPILPFNSLYALRLSSKECCGEEQIEVINLFFCAAWEQGLNIGSDEVVRELLSKSGYPVDKWMELVGERIIRAELKKNTKVAINEGVFGLPSFIVREREKIDEYELFWGNDSTSDLLNYLEDRDPLSRKSTHPKSEEYKEKLRLFQSRYQSL